jgi:hypothetical protein
MPPFFSFWARDLPDKDFIPLRNLRSDHQSGNSSALILISGMESCSKKDFLYKIRTWNIESKNGAAAMDQEKIALQYGEKRPKKHRSVVPFPGGGQASGNRLACLYRFP